MMDALIAAYGPQSQSIISAVLGIAAFTLVFGLLPSKIPNKALARGLAWIWVLVATILTERLSANEAGGFRMLAICLNLLLSMKVVIALEDGSKLSFLQWLTWCSWPGMRPELFAAERIVDDKSRSEGRAFLLKGTIRLTLGSLLFLASRLIYENTHSRLLATILLLPGISLVLHFGLFNLLAGFWRILGIQSYSLFPAPLSSKTLREFWGKRWNLPFTEMVQRAIYRPLSPNIGRNNAALAGFLFSGLLHELAISLPLQASFGLPSLYFALHGGLILLERRYEKLQNALQESPLGHLWTLSWLALPMPILFHPPFLKGVVWPLIGISVD